ERISHHTKARVSYCRERAASLGPRRKVSNGQIALLAFYGRCDGSPWLSCFNERLRSVSINFPIRFNEQWDGIGLEPSLYRVMDLAPMASRPSRCNTIEVAFNR